MLQHPEGPELLRRIKKPSAWVWAAAVAVALPAILTAVAIGIGLCAISRLPARDQFPKARAEPADVDDFKEVNMIETPPETFAPERACDVRGPLPTIDPNLAPEQLLPPAPETCRAPVYVGLDLGCVPEIAFAATPAGPLTTEQWRGRLGRTIAGALLLNAKQEDGFLKALLRTRPDLAGLPFVMGKKCRTTKEDMELFKVMATATHNHDMPEWLAVMHKAAGKGCPDRMAHAGLAAARQARGPSTGDQGAELARFLAALPVCEATEELARLAVFSTDASVREAAIKGLLVRREADSAKVLAGALRYPWPQVARNATAAIVRLERIDLAPHLVDALQAPGPRAPKEEEKHTAAHELVRVNHLRSCLLCHAPVEGAKFEEAGLTADIPLPSEKPGDPKEGYGQPMSNLLVRVDVTYLRQDFSAMQKVAEPGPWPEQQRFDYFVRRRVLSVEEAEGLRKRLEAEKRDGLSPYQHASYWALRDLTGRDLPPRADAWRRALKLKGT